jgi:hypothetical protein
MARLIALGTLVTRCRRRADKESDQSVSGDEFKGYISEKYGQLRDSVAEADPTFFEDVEDIVATGASSYSMPADLLSVASVDLLVNGAIGSRPSLRLLMGQERVEWASRTGEASCYAFSGSSIELHPHPTSGTYRIRYVPQSPDLTDAADNTDVDVLNSAGEAFLIWGVASMACDKGEADIRNKTAQSEAALARCISLVVNRAIHEPRRRVVERLPIDQFDPEDWRYRP